MILLIITHLIALVLGGLLMFFFKNNKKGTSHTTRSSYNDNQNKVDKTNPSHDIQNMAEHLNSRQELKQLQETKKPFQSDTLERKPSKKELQRQQRKEEREKKRQEEADRQTALEELRRKQSFNPRTTKPEIVVYTNLAVSDGHLVPCTVGQNYYYHSWEYEGRYFFEFFCEQSKAAKAINNRSVILDPFCQKDSKSVPVDEAKLMEIIEFGEVDKELNIISKSIIRFK